MSSPLRFLWFGLGFCIAAPVALADEAARDATALLDSLPVGDELVLQRRLLRTPVVLWYRDYDEVLVGSALGPETFEAGQSVDVRSTTGAYRCVGSTVYRVVPPEARPRGRCDGVRSDVLLSCSDGRTIRLRIDREEHCLAGMASGRDHEGNVVGGLFGGSRERLEVVLEGVLEAAAHRDGFPAASMPAGARPRGIQTGTGFFVSADGYLVTNYHVIAGAARVEVHFDDGDRIEAEVVVQEPDNDLALLRVEAIREPLTLRRRNDLTPGQKVATLGYPVVSLGGRERKTTFGRVRALAGPRDAPGFAEVDVPIEPGNSGGPLLNRKGEVVGVVKSMGQPSAQPSHGIQRRPGAVAANYAIVSDRVHRMVERHLGDAGLPHDHRVEGETLSEVARAAEDSVVLVVAR